MRARKYGNADVYGTAFDFAVCACRKSKAEHLADSASDFVGNDYGGDTGVLFAEISVPGIFALAFYDCGVCGTIDRVF